MAIVRTTIHKTVMGDKRVHFGTVTIAGSDTSGTIDTGLRTVEAFMMNGVVSFTEADGVITMAAGCLLASGGSIGGWIAIGY